MIDSSRLLHFTWFSSRRFRSWIRTTRLDWLSQLTTRLSHAFQIPIMWAKTWQPTRYCGLDLILLSPLVRRLTKPDCTHACTLVATCLEWIIKVQSPITYKKAPPESVVRSIKLISIHTVSSKILRIWECESSNKMRRRYRVKPRDFQSLEKYKRQDTEWNSAYRIDYFVSVRLFFALFTPSPLLLQIV